MNYHAYFWEHTSCSVINIFCEWLCGWRLKYHKAAFSQSRESPDLRESNYVSLDLTPGVLFQGVLEGSLRKGSGIQRSQEILTHKSKNQSWWHHVSVKGGSESFWFRLRFTFVWNSQTNQPHILKNSGRELQVHKHAETVDYGKLNSDNLKTWLWHSQEKPSSGSHRVKCKLKQPLHGTEILGSYLDFACPSVYIFFLSSLSLSPSFLISSSLPLSLLPFFSLPFLFFSFPFSA